MSRFLAEDFRNLMDALDNITDKEPVEKDRDEHHGDVDDLMQTERPTGITKEQVTDINSLIEFLDQFSELDQYRNPDAQYDDAYYEDMPLEVVEQVTGLTEDDIKKISDDTPAYEGDHLIRDDKLTVFGGD